MEGKYLLAYTIFSPYYNGFKSFYRHFDDLERLRLFVESENVKDNCIVYEKNMDLIKGR